MNVEKRPRWLRRDCNWCTYGGGQPLSNAYMYFCAFLAVSHQKVRYASLARGWLPKGSDAPERIAPLYACAQVEGERLACPSQYAKLAGIVARKRSSCSCLARDKKGGLAWSARAISAILVVSHYRERVGAGLLLPLWRF